ncbi:hypothetical protein HU200_058225 [Digitaria exilis]|uniref:Uncharacterized protein n=1 Tax=Digitaria exilis TaxID=1010633 RepID=A0A835AA19_9POAL|nr:hypothetical protein HU200_058225 [Digitaria exilis]
MCISGTCDYLGHGTEECHCCVYTSQKKYCYRTMEECRSKCRACNPQCLP